jgi:aminopeptidase N
VNQYRTVETADLRTAIEDTTGQGMNWFFRQWIERGGHPEIALSWTYNAERKDLAVTIEQRQKVDAITPLFRASVELEIATSNEVKLERISLARATETFHFSVATRPTRVVFDPRDWLLDQQQVTATKQELLDQLARSEHVFARLQALKKLAEQKDDAEVKTALLKVAQEDKFWAVHQEAVKILGTLNGDEIRALLLKLARSETRVEVRREAVQALHRFPHDDTKRVLREVIAQEPSYKTVAEALHSLVKVDRAHCAADLRQAMERASPQEVILLSAIDGLVELKDSTAEEQWGKMLQQPLSAERRAALLGAIARAKPSDVAALEPIKSQLSHRRPQVRKEAIRTLVEIGNPRGIDWLQERRVHETSYRALQSLDEAIEKIRARQKQTGSLQERLDELREQNKSLEERLKKLEKE